MLILEGRGGEGREGEAQNPRLDGLCDATASPLRPVFLHGREKFIPISQTFRAFVIQTCCEDASMDGGPVTQRRNCLLLMWNMPRLCVNASGEADQLRDARNVPARAADARKAGGRVGEDLMSSYL